MYKVTLKGKEYGQNLEFIFDDFDECKQFMEMGLIFANEEIHVNLELVKEDEEGCQ